MSIKHDLPPEAPVLWPKNYVLVNDEWQTEEISTHSNFTSVFAILVFNSPWFTVRHIDFDLCLANCGNNKAPNSLWLRSQELPTGVRSTMATYYYLLLRRPTAIVVDMALSCPLAVAWQIGWVYPVDQSEAVFTNLSAIPNLPKTQCYNGKGHQHQP